MDLSGGYKDPFIADFYDYVVPYRNRRDVDFFVELARDGAGPVLEVGCGTGRVLLPTARAGIEVVGLDSSPLMLSVCRNKLSSEPESVQAKVIALVEGDMRAFELGREFSMVTIPFRPFQHLLTVEDQLSCLVNIRRHLIAGGRLILDIFNPSLPHLTDERYLSEHGEELEFTTADGRRVVRSARIVSRDYFTQVTDNELIYDVTHPDGHKERLVHRFLMRYLFRFEAEHLLARCGFSIEQVYADYDKSPFGSTYPGELIFVAQKS
ncbi:MAG: class I SAM-dependent methyltransferase [Pyrinomonadaceae bacterium]